MSTQQEAATDSGQRPGRAPERAIRKLAGTAARRTIRYASYRLRLSPQQWAIGIALAVVWVLLPIPHWVRFGGLAVLWMLVPAALWLRAVGLLFLVGSFAALGDATSVPESWLVGRDIGKWIDDIVDWMVAHWRPFLKSRSDELLRAILLPLQRWLMSLPWWLTIGATTAIAYKMVGRRFALVSLTLLLILAILDLMEPAIVTLAIVLIATGTSCLIGIPLGIAAAKSNPFEGTLRPVLDTMQTMPSFVYLVPVVMLLGIGKVPAVIATVVYAVPPIIRLTNLGIRQVDPELLEAGQAFGATRMQLLLKIQIPLALPTIMAGVNQTVMMALAMVVIASMIGARGLGIEVLNGISRLEAGRALLGGIGIVIMAVIIDRVSQRLVRDPREQ